MALTLPVKGILNAGLHMDFAYLLRILARRKWLILAVMCSAAAATFIMIGQKPEQYRSGVILATGIVNYKGLNSDNSDAFVQQYQIENAFANRIEFTQSRSSVKILTLHMLKHDLGATLNGTSGQSPFRKANAGLVPLSESEIKEIYTALQKINIDSIEDPSFSQQFDYLLDKVSRSYGYDHDAIRRSLSVKRKAQTDYLTIEFVTENPLLSQYLANEYARLFINYYTNLALREKKKNVESFAKLVADKMAVVDTIKAVKYGYLRRKGLPAIGKQSEDIINQIADYEKSRQEAQSRFNASGESMVKIDKYIRDRSSHDAGEVSSRVVNKNDADEQMVRVRDLTKRSLEKGGKDAEIEAELAEAKTEMEQSVRSSARAIGRPKGNDESKRTKEDLYKERVNYDLEKIESEKTVAQLDNKIYSLRGRLSSIVADDEYASNLESDQFRAESELDRVNKDYITAKLALEDYESPLSVIENAQLPEWPEPNRQLLLSIFAAIVAGTFTVIVLFLLAYIDNSLHSPDMFKKFTGNLPLLGVINAVPVKGLQLETVFTANGATPQGELLRENLRKIRTHIINSDAHNFLFVSTKKSEGKTFAMLALAQSLALNNKKVVLIDTGFKTPLPESFTDQPTPNADLINTLIRECGMEKAFQVKSRANAPENPDHRVDIIGNSALEKSPSEILENKKFTHFLARLREHYDYIFMESAALNKFSDAQELEPFADKIISVFNAKSAIAHADKDALDYLKSLNDKHAGSILTEVEARNLNT